MTGHQPREHTVPCGICARRTLNHHAICTNHPLSARTCPTCVLGERAAADVADAAADLAPYIGLVMAT